VWLDPEWGGVLDGKSHEWEWDVLPAQPLAFYASQASHCACASVQWLTLSGAGAEDGALWSPWEYDVPTGPP